MAHVVMFHSVYGRRPAVLSAADLIRSAGHTVAAPDLYAGQAVDSAEEGIAGCDRIGWPVVLRRTRQALSRLPAQTVLGGLSMGAAVVAALLEDRPAAAGLLLLHNTGGSYPSTVRPGLPVQLHMAVPDIYQTTTEITAWEQAMIASGAAVQVFRYPGAGHLFTGPGTSDSEPVFAALTWDRTASPG